MTEEDDGVLADFIDDVAALCEEYELTIADAIEGLSYVLANVMSQMTDGRYDPAVGKGTEAMLDHCYKFHCGSEESANITIQ